MKLGKKRNASVFQTAPVSAVESGNHPLSTEPELITEVENASESTAERFANLQFGPDVDILNPPDEQDAAPLRDNRTLRAHGLFFTPETEGKDFSMVLAEVQAWSYHYTPEDVSLMGQILDDYIDALTLAQGDPAAVSECVRDTVLKINALNEECGRYLIDTWRRERLCGFINSAAELAGLSQEKDLTQQHRMW